MTTFEFGISGRRFPFRRPTSVRSPTKTEAMEIFVSRRYRNPSGSTETPIGLAPSLAREKVSRRAIAISLGVSRNTVRRVIEEHAVQRESEHSALPQPKTAAPRPSKLEPYKGRIGELLNKYADITAQRVFEILCDEGFDGGYTAVKKHVRRVRPKPPPKPSLQTPDYGPGKMAESDWSPYELTYTDGTKEEIQLFGYVLVHQGVPEVLPQRLWLREVDADGAPLRSRAPGQAPVPKWHCLVRPSPDPAAHPWAAGVGHSAIRRLFPRRLVENLRQLRAWDTTPPI